MAGKEELSNYKKAEVALRRYSENTAREIKKKINLKDDRHVSKVIALKNLIMKKS